MNIDWEFFQLVREWLLNVEQSLEDFARLSFQPIENTIYVSRLSDGAIEIRSQPRHQIARRNFPHANQPSIVPGRIIPAQLDLQALQSIAANPLFEQHRIIIFRFATGQFGFVNRIESADKVP